VLALLLTLATLGYVLPKTLVMKIGKKTVFTVKHSLSTRRIAHWGEKAGGSLIQRLSTKDVCVASWYLSILYSYTVFKHSSLLNILYTKMIATYFRRSGQKVVIPVSTALPLSG